MGGILSSISRLLGTKKSVRMVMVGLDGAGKTTILYKLKLGELVQTVPTIGFNVETIRYKNISFTVWDVGGQYKIRALWRYYYSGVDAAIFVVDASDTQAERLDECKEEIHYLMHENDLADAAVLIFANKQDLPGAISAQQVAERLNLLALKQRRWYVQASSAKTGEGIFEGLEWIAQVIQEKNKSFFRASNSAQVESRPQSERISNDAVCSTTAGSPKDPKGPEQTEIDQDAQSNQSYSDLKDFYDSNPPHFTQAQAFHGSQSELFPTISEPLSKE